MPVQKRFWKLIEGTTYLWVTRSICYLSTLFLNTSNRSIVNLSYRARGVMVIVVGNGHGDTSSNPGRDPLYFTNSTITLGKGMNPIILPPAMGK